MKKQYAILLSMSLTGLCLCAAIAFGEDTKPGVDEPSALVSCLANCQKADCFKECLAKNPVVVSGQGKAVGGGSIVDCSREAFENISTCSRLFLVESDPIDVAGFWDCVGVALQVFVEKCPTIQKSATPETTSKLATVTMDFLLQGAERDLRSAHAGTLADRLAHSKKHESDGGGADGRAKQEGGPGPDRPSFAECANAFRQNRDTCTTLFPEAGSGQTDCYFVARQEFQRCMGLKESA